MDRLLKKSYSCFDKLSTNGNYSTIPILGPFVLRLSKGERGFFNSLWISKQLENRGMSGVAVPVPQENLKSKFKLRI
jgi:hypothetical protein